MKMLFENNFMVKKTDNLWGLKEETKKSSWRVFPSCCTFLFRPRKVVDVSHSSQVSTPVVAVTLLPNDDIK